MTTELLAWEMASVSGRDDVVAMQNDIRCNPVFALACQLVSRGFCVIPLSKDGKRPVRKWKEFQYRFPTVAELREWFIENDYAPAIVTGEISGITAIDCDNADAVRIADANGLGSRVYQDTKRGRHFIFRWNGERNTVRVGGIDGIDRRGEGGYIKAYPGCAAWTRESIWLAPNIDDRFAE